MIDSMLTPSVPMAAVGLDYVAKLLPTARCTRSKPTAIRPRKPGTSCYMATAFDAGAFGTTAGIKEKWCAKADTELTPKERAERDRRWQQQQEIREAERRRQHDAASTEAQRFSMPPSRQKRRSPLSQRKQVNATLASWRAPGRSAGRTIVFVDPTANRRRQAGSVQAIFSEKRGDRDKDFLKGGGEGRRVLRAWRSRQCRRSTSPRATPPPPACWTPPTVNPGPRSWRAMPATSNRWPRRSGRCTRTRPSSFRRQRPAPPGQSGLTKATAAAKAIKADLAVPEFAEGEAGSDFNDLAALRGVEAVREALLKAGKPTAAKAEKPLASDIQRHRTIALLLASYRRTWMPQKPCSVSMR